jgi:D-3-phosphoglycerate dehydrogenase
MINACRMDLSTYHHADFRKWEKQRLESIPGLSYGKRISTQGQNILLSNTHTRFDELSVEELAHISLIIHANSGYDNIPVQLAHLPNFEIVVGNPIRARAVATYVLSQLFAHYNPAPHVKFWQEGRQWDRRPMDSLKVLLLGFGHIGKIVHESLSPLVQEIIVHDPFLKIEVEDLLLQLPDIDVVIPLMSLNPTSKGFVSSAFLRSLKDDFVLINGARGDLIDQESLISVLRENPAAKAYLDVFRKEPFECNEFDGLTNVKLSSHVAGVYTGIDQNILDFEERVVEDFVALKTASFREKYRSLMLRNRIHDDFLI